MLETHQLSFAAVALILFGCGGDEQAARAPELKTVSSDATVLVEINEQVGNIQVDDERLYWMGTPERANYYGAALRSCDKHDCPHSLVTYEGSRAIARTGYGLSGGEVYWFRLLDDEPPQEWALLACPIAGCVGNPRVVWRERSYAPQLASFGEHEVLLAGDDIYRMPLPEGGRPEFVVAPRQDGALAYLRRGDYVYWLESHSLRNAMTSELAVYRARADGSTLAESLVEHVAPTTGSFVSGLGFSSSLLAASDTDLYWPHGGLRGGVSRCPLDGCDGVPTEVLPPVSAPSGLRVDGGQLFFQHQGLTGSIALSACSLEQCATEQRALASGLESSNAVAVDADFVYTATGELPAFGTGEWVDPQARIRRFPRPR